MYNKQPNHIQVSKTNISVHSYFDNYRIKNKWIEKILLKLKFIIPIFASFEVITYSNLDAKSLHIAILEAMSDAGYRGPECKIIMGENKFRELTGNKDVIQALQFKTGPFADSYRADYYNIPVYVYPHIEGWAVI